MATLMELEEELLLQQARKNESRLRELLAEEFREFGSSGRVFTRDEIVVALAGDAAAELTLRDFAAERIGGECVLVTYRALRHEVDGLVRESLRSSIWSGRNDRWQMIFHQGTKVGG